MFFKQIQNKMFPSGFFISDNRIFAIGIVGKNIQVLSKINACWTIVEKYKMADENMKREWLAKILKSLELIATKDSEIIKKALPIMQKKQYHVIDVDASIIIAGPIISNLKSKDKQYEQHGPEQKSTKKNNTESRKEEWK